MPSPIGKETEKYLNIRKIQVQIKTHSHHYFLSRSLVRLMCLSLLFKPIAFFCYNCHITQHLFVFVFIANRRLLYFSISFLSLQHCYRYCQCETNRCQNDANPVSRRIEEKRTQHHINRNIVFCLLYYLT